MAAITRLLTLEEAARRLGLRPSTLVRYAQAGKIRAKLFVVGEGMKETMLVELEMQPHHPDDDEPEEAITITEASRRYGVPDTLLSRWVRWGLIRLYERRGRKCLISSKDAKRLAQVYHQVREAHGRFKGRSIRRILRRQGMLS